MGGGDSRRGGEPFYCFITVRSHLLQTPDSVPTKERAKQVRAYGLMKGKVNRGHCKEKGILLSIARKGAVDVCYAIYQNDVRCADIRSAIYLYPQTRACLPVALERCNYMSILKCQ